MTVTVTTSGPHITEALSLPGHVKVYHIRCNNCDATTVFDVDTDHMRMLCPSCRNRLTLPATVKGACSSCGTVSEFAHTLAGHSAACSKCGQPVVLGPVVGRTEVRRRVRTRRPRGRDQRTLAFSEGAERSLILIAAAIATLVFVVALSMR